VAPGEMKDVAMEGNALGSARHATEEVSTDLWRPRQMQPGK